MQQVSGAVWLARMLKDYAVDHVFFVDAVLRRTLVEMEAVGIKRVLAHSEKAAAYMADGYARISGRPGVCLAQSVGAANLASGLQDAWLHRAPLIALTGRKPPPFQHRNAYQEVEHAPLFQPVTKWQAAVDDPHQLPVLIPQAFRAATEGTPRPVHLDLAGLQGEVIEAATLPPPPPAEPRHRRAPARRPPPTAEEIEAAAAALARADRPVLVAGAGAVLAGAHEALRRFAERLRIPVATSLGGRGIVPTTHSLHIGVLGTYSAPCTNAIVHEADLVVLVGCHAGDQVTTDWTVPAAGTAVVQIDVDPLEIGRNYLDTVGVCGDPALGLAALLEHGLPTHEAWAERATGAFLAWRKEMAPALESAAAPIRVERLCRELTRALPEEAVLVADTGYSGIWTGTLVDLPHAGQTYLRAAGSLGWAFPAALGAKCAATERPVVCFCGDGAFYYHLAELETARRRGLAVVVVVNNNSAFGQGLPRVRALYDGRTGDPDEIIRFGPTDFAAVARAFGVEGIRVEDPDGIAPALERALRLGEPVVVDVVTDALPRAPEAWRPS